MSVRRSHTAYVLFAACLLASGDTRAGTEPTVTVGVPAPANPPIVVMTDDGPDGLAAAPAVAALQAMGLAVRFRELPFARLYHELHQGDIDVALSVLKTADRAGRAHYSAPIVTEFPLLLTARPDAHPVRCVEDLAALRIGGRLGFAYPLVDGIALPLVRENSYERLIDRAATGSLDAALLGSVTGPWLARRLGHADSVVALTASVGSAPIGAGLSLARFDADDLAEFDRQVAAFKAGPRWRKLAGEFAPGDALRQWPVMPFCRDR